MLTPLVQQYFQIAKGGKDVDWALSIAVVCAFVLVVYFLAMNELIIQIGDHSVTVWGFGQVRD